MTDGRTIEATERPEGPVSGALKRFVELILILLMAFITLLSFTQVIMRYLFSNSIIWAEEIARYGFIWIVFLAAGVLTGTQSHIAFSLVNDLLPSGPRRAVGMLGHALIVFLGFFVAIKGWSIVSIGFDVPAPASGIPIAYVQMILVVFGAVLIWRGTTAFLRLLLRRKEA